MLEEIVKLTKVWGLRLARKYCTSFWCGDWLLNLLYPMPESIEGGQISECWWIRKFRLSPRIVPGPKTSNLVWFGPWLLDFLQPWPESEGMTKFEDFLNCVSGPKKNLVRLVWRLATGGINLELDSLSFVNFGSVPGSRKGRTSWIASGLALAYWTSQAKIHCNLKES